MKGPTSPRLDLWLVQARFFRTRTLAQSLITSGHLRLNGQHCLKPAHPVSPGDTLTFPQGHKIRVIRILALSHRRGPATEAQTLYQDLESPAPLL